MYTLKIQFVKGGKVCHFASMKHMGTGKCFIEKKCAWSTIRDYEEVFIVGHEEGISHKATKWRTGSEVTAKQREKFPHQLIKKENNMENITLEQVQGACAVFKRLSESSNIRTVGLSVIGNIYYQLEDGGTRHVFIEPTVYNITKMLTQVNADPRKAKLQDNLQELLKKAEEIKAQIEGL